ncbi:putative transcription factor WD40-like family [Lupinus albus]|uniref:Putative transcription factor WD40-like family n=1 Tax=Lupinus albus TaxID=3870 RepID=A0A6A4QWE0_LUPAL|nr:putative transcription factor WD40-like family [Lupinus albus]
MFAKRFLEKVVLNHSNQKLQHHHHGSLVQSSDLDPKIVIHYGIPLTASLLAFDPIQRLLAIATLDGRLKVIGGDNIEGILVSPKQLPYKFLEFLQNQGYLIGVLNDNDIQVWSLESRSLVCSSQWESNITAFSVISGSHFINVGDEHGILSVIKFEAEEGKLLKSSYHLSAKFLKEAAGLSDPIDDPIVGVLTQPSSGGNRLLIAFQDGLIILWDISEGRIVFLGGGKDLQLKDGGGNSSTEVDTNDPNDIIDHKLGDREISALCWASSTGSILAVGYLDGDILFWNLSSAETSKGQHTSSKNIVKLQLSSAERRLPVIVLRWSNNHKSNSDCAGQLFVYGGDEIGSEEVLTVLTLEWSSGMETVRCTSRADLTLSGSFADLTLLPSPGASALNSRDGLFVLTNPGQIHFYDNDSLSALTSQGKRTPSVSSIEFPALLPMTDPSLTVAKLIKFPSESNSSKVLAEAAAVLRTDSTLGSATHSNWPLTGGVPSQLSTAEGTAIERVYFAGYSNGSVLVYDATHSVLSCICYIEGEVQGIKVAGSNAPVTKLDFCPVSLLLAVGNECGLVLIYNLKGRSNGTKFHFVTETKSEVHESPQAKGPHCCAVFCLLGSPVQALSFSNSGTKLAVGFLSGRVVVCDMNSSSVMFLIDGVPNSTSAITSLVWKEQAHFISAVNILSQSETTSGNSHEGIIFILSRDGKINVVEGHTGKKISSQPLHVEESTAISMYVIDNSISAPEASNEKQHDESVKNTASPDEPLLESKSANVNSSEAEPSPSESMSSGDLLLDPLVLLCCENSLWLFSAKSLIQGNKKTIRKVKHVKSCCWTTMFMKDGKLCGLLSLFQTGKFEIRSLPDLELVAESSLLSILRWSYKVNMDKTMCSDDNGHIVLTNGYELAFISLLAGENEFRGLEQLPCLHDKVLAAAANAAFSFSSIQKKEQTIGPGILGGIVKGFKGGKNSTKDLAEISTSNFAHLEDIFLKPPLLDSPLPASDNNEVELDIDDIEIDEPITKVSTSSKTNVKNKQKDKLSDREKLFQGGTKDDVTPRVRTREEILATYRKTGDAASVAADAKNKLLERQEKLERISQRTAELQSGAENFASLANELVKTMERRKWWQI